MVLDLDVMHETVTEAHDLVRHPEEPAEQIGIVRSLLREGPAAVHGARAAIRAGAVVSRVTPELHRHVRRKHTPEGTRVEQALHGDIVRTHAALIGDGELHASVPAGAYHAVHCVGGDFQNLLGEHVLAERGGFESALVVKPVGRGKNDRVEGHVHRRECGKHARVHGQALRPAPAA